ncbi:hypothetical protein LINGRAHAP2_LOCUS2004 [Linum grandiflorum]
MCTLSYGFPITIKLKTPSIVDKIISAKLPDQLIDPVGYKAVTKFMLHGPCGQTRPTSPYVKEGNYRNSSPNHLHQKQNLTRMSHLAAELQI